MIYFALLATLVNAATYPVVESWKGDNFFSGWRSDPSLYDNTTNGDVLWARVSNSSIYSVVDGKAILKVDNTSFVPYNEKRYAPKLLSKTSYGLGTVWVMDASHLPYGCSVWPSFWLQGTNWPDNGEVDIMEGQNLQSGNQVAIHTEGNCTATAGGDVSGSLTQSVCQVGQNSDSGCIYKDNNANSYGEAFASAGGGVYVCELAEEGVKIWFLTRSSVPSSLTADASSIDTSTLGTPVAWYSNSSCNFSQNFGPQTMTLTTTLCGTWAGQADILEQTCGALTGTNTCYTQYVIDDAAATYANAYFEINYINVYSSASAVNSSTGDLSTSTSATLSPGSTGEQGSQAVAATSSRAAGYVTYEGPGAAVLGAVLTAIGAGIAAVLV